MTDLVIEALPLERADEVSSLSMLSGLRLDIADELLQRHAAVFVARSATGAAPLGYVLVWKVADEIQVVDLATHPSHRRRGVARRLLQHLATLGRDGFTSIQLEVRAGNHAARALYANVGFIEQRSRRRYYKDGEDAVEMSWQLGVDSAALT